MLESIVLAIVKSLASYLVKYYLESGGTVKIDGAPNWFYKQEKDQICVSTHATGGIAAVDRAKDSNKDKMVETINELISVMIYEKFRNVSDGKEQLLVKKFAKDDNLPVFVTSTLKFKNIEYDKETYMAFVRGCIDNEEIIDYQKERLGKIRKAVTEKRAGDAFGELDGE